MGFFSKIKDNFNHGGVDVTIQAPTGIPSSGTTANIVCTLVAKGQLRNIKAINVSLVQKSIYRQPSSSFSDNNRMSASTNETDTRVTVLSEQDMPTPFVINAGETKQIPLTLQTSQINTDTPGLTIAGFSIGTGQPLSVSYEFVVRVDVEGIALDPGASQQVIILAPEQLQPQPQQIVS